MAKIKFYLKDKSENLTSIYCLIHYGAYILRDDKKIYKPLKYYISESINPKFWNAKESRASETKDFPTHPEFNRRLKDIETIIETTLYKFQIDKTIPTIETVKQTLDEAIKKEKIQSKVDTKTLSEKERIKNMSLFEFFDHHLKTAQIKHSTYKGYNTTKNSLEEYQTAKNIKLSFKNIDIDFYNSYVVFLQKKGLSKNTIGQRIKIIKAILREAHDRDIEVCKDYTKKSFKRISETADTIYLNESELKQLYNKKDFPAYLERTRDLFLVGCYTGLRVSDYSRLKKEHITKDGKITITTQKTGQKVVIPMHNIVKEIFKKYNFNFPKPPTGQVFNRFLKEMGELAELNEVVCTEITKGGLKVTKNTPKHDLITSHTARRSFATNTFLAGVPTLSIMKITGHKTESAFMKYIRMSADDNANKMKTHKFFKPNLKIAK